METLQKIIKPLNLCCFHIVSATDFIQTLYKTEDFELFILYSRFFYLLLFLRYFLFLFLFRFYNGCVIARVEKQ